ncbi:Uncharacterized protein FKW44_004001, partial [Caligus rogercresseyi]
EEKAEQKHIDDIHKDLHRNFPTHELFGGNYEKIGQTELFLVLKAYSVLNPVQGYCQAQAPIAALLLMQMPSEAAFWCLVAICDNYIPATTTKAWRPFNSRAPFSWDSSEESPPGYIVTSASKRLIPFSS